MKCDALKAMFYNLVIEFVTLCDVPDENGKTIMVLKLQVALDSKGIAHLMTLVEHCRLSFFCVAAESGELQKSLSSLEAKALDAIAFTGKVQVEVSSVTGKQDVLTANLEDIAQEVQCIPCLAENAGSLRACAAELEKSSETTAPQVCAMPRTANMEMVAAQTSTERAKHTALIAQLDGYIHEIDGKLDFLARRSNIADPRYSKLVDACDLPKRKISNSRICREEMVKQLANVS